MGRLLAVYVLGCDGLPVELFCHFRALQWVFLDATTGGVELCLGWIALAERRRLVI